MKRTAAVLLGVCLAGAGWFCYPRAAAGQGEPVRPAAQKADRPARPAEEDLRKEIAQLKQQLQQALQRVEALEAKLAPAANEATYQGKPAAFWVRQMKDHDPHYRLNAAYALSALLKVNRSVLPVLVEALNDPDDDVARWAPYGLKAAGKEAVVPLLAALKKAPPRTQVGISTTFRLIGPGARAAVPALLGLLKSPEENSRAAAAAALGSVTGRENKPDPTVVPALVERVKKGGPLERYAAAWALGRIGPNARTAVPALIELLKDEKKYNLNLDARSEDPAFGTHRLPGGGYPSSVLAYIPATALGNIGPDARAALPALRRFADRAMRRSFADQGGLTPLIDAAREAIAKIDPGSVNPGKADGRPEPQPRRKKSPE